MKPIIRVHAIISGHVQGVYYRASTQAEAERLQLTGWVRNLNNGNVEFEAQGQQDAIQALLDWALIGPQHAQVSSVDWSAIPPQNQEEQFQVLR